MQPIALEAITSLGILGIVSLLGSAICFWSYLGLHRTWNNANRPDKRTAPALNKWRVWKASCIFLLLASGVLEAYVFAQL